MIQKPQLNKKYWYYKNLLNSNSIYVDYEICSGKVVGIFEDTVFFRSDVINKEYVYSSQQTVINAVIKNICRQINEIIDDINDLKKVI